MIAGILYTALYRLHILIFSIGPTESSSKYDHVFNKTIAIYDFSKDVWFNKRS